MESQSGDTGGDSKKEEHIKDTALDILQKLPKC